MSEILTDRNMAWLEEEERWREEASNCCGVRNYKISEREWELLGNTIR